MQTVTFTKAFTVEVDAATKLTYPEGWTGPVDDDIAEAAAEEGCFAPTPKAEKPAKPKAEKPAAAAGDAADAAAPPA